MALTPWRVSARERADASPGSWSRANVAPHTTTGAPSRASARVCRCALLAALALALTALESLLPLPLPVPGMRLGIANIVTVVAAFWLGPADAVIVLGVRIVLAALLTGQLATLPFSLAGGVCALAVTLGFVRFSSPERVRLCAMASAVAHNCGQIAVAVVVTGTPAIVFYLPALLVAGTVAGFLTGTVAATVLARLPHPKRLAAHEERARV